LWASNPAPDFCNRSETGFGTARTPGAELRPETSLLRRRSTRAACAPIGLALCLLPRFSARLQAQDIRDEFWPELNLYLKLNEKSRLFFLYSATKLDNRQTHSEGSFGAYFDFYAVPLFRPRLRAAHMDPARSKSLLVRVGYLGSRTPSSDSSDASVEQTPTVEGHGRAPLPWGLLLTDRNRWDFRFVDGDFQPRYRNRLKLERTFEVRCPGITGITPYGHGEAFYDWRFHKFHRFRYAAGLELSLGRHVTLESYYLRQHDTVSAPQHVNAVGFALQLYFP
jgi:hypothetical protein